MKSLTLIFYGNDGEAAKVLAGKIRKDGGSAQLRHAYAFDGEAEIEADRVIILQDVNEHDLSRLRSAYGDKVVQDKPSVSLPPPPPPPADPLAKLPVNWKSMPVAELKKIAAAVGDGRAVDNAEQAVAVIEAALAARK